MTTTQIDLDDHLIERAKQILDVETKRAAVNGALAALAEREDRAVWLQKHFDFFGTAEGRATIDDVERRHEAEKEGR